MVHRPGESNPDLNVGNVQSDMLNRCRPETKMAKQIEFMESRNWFGWKSLVGAVVDMVEGETEEAEVAEQATRLATVMH
jgi:hypothetical protein